MYDASSTLDAVHWQAMAGALVICFSLELHYKVQASGVDSLYIKYFPKQPECVGETSPSFAGCASDSSLRKPNESHGLRVFFWERLPETPLNLSSVMKTLSGLPVSHLHVHQASDPGRTPSLIPCHDDYPISSSSWFDSKDDYFRAIQNSDIFIAPRFSEGIGMGFLEAMNLGCCVIAHDLATHNEYISNWKNGILVDFLSTGNTVISATAESIRSMGSRAKADAKMWRDGWVNFYSKIALKSIANYLNYSVIEPVISCALPEKVSFLKSVDELTALSAAHQSWDVYWSHLLSLRDISLGRRSQAGLLMPSIHRLVLEGNLSQACEELDMIIGLDQGRRTVFIYFEINCEIGLNNYMFSVEAQRPLADRQVLMGIAR